MADTGAGAPAAAAVGGGGAKDEREALSTLLGGNLLRGSSEVGDMARLTPLTWARPCPRLIPPVTYARALASVPALFAGAARPHAKF